MDDSVEKLCDFYDAFANDLPPSPHVREWLLDGVYAWRYKGVPIGIALGIIDSVEERIQRRNNALKVYAARLPDDYLWTKARKIAAEIKEMRQAGNYSNRAINHNLKIIDSIYPLPSTSRQIYAILKS